ncbi:MAG TPA: glycosyltransferase family 2 protein [Gemmatimonadaceae bacterium]|jgi:cellulose synthase/poly-beta-1,6-N-acetylglucosamine synthase-like glycosyltransferase
MTALWLVIRVVLWIGLVPIFAASVYLGFLALLARRRTDMQGSTTTRFDIVVPSHNEETGIEETVRSLKALAYPSDMFRLIVVADNCTDRTAELARGAGAIVVERFNTEKRGKGYALELVYEKCLKEGFADAVVVVDADTVVTSNLLSAFSRRFDEGAEAVQAEYAVPGDTDSWRGRLMVIAFTLFHAVRSSARERLGFSSGLRGNGMAFAVDLLRRIPSRAYSLVEDVEYGCELGLNGVRVVYAEEAVVMSEMPTTGAAARSQRERWEGGRMKLVREYVPKLIGRGLAEGSGVKLDLAADLIVPPLATIGLANALGLGISTLLYAFGNAGPALVVFWAVSLLALVAYVARGAAMARVGPRVILDLAWAPVYAVWKLTLLFRRRKTPRSEWVRTERSTSPKGADR